MTAFVVRIRYSLFLALLDPFEKTFNHLSNQIHDKKGVGLLQCSAVYAAKF